MSNDPIPQWDQLPDLTWTEKLAYLTHQFLTMEQTACKLTHHFEQGLYIREIHIPAGTLLIGRIHRHGHVCQLLEGSVVLIHQEGKKEGFHAPSQIITLPGYQMVVHAVTDCIARTVHPNPTEERDIDILEADIFEPVQPLLQKGKQIAQGLLT